MEIKITATVTFDEAAEPFNGHKALSPGEHDALREALEALKAPESFTAMAQIAEGVSCLHELTPQQAFGVLASAVELFAPAKGVPS